MPLPDRPLESYQEFRRHVLVDDSVLEARRVDWKLPEPRYSTGALAKYAKLVGSAGRGAVCE